MTLIRPRTLLALLAATILMSLAVPTVDAHMPRPKHYRVGGAITLDTNLLSKSGASAWAINEYLASTTSLPPLGEAFVAAERKYGVNARFLVAAAMHESARGTSYIARVKHNLFGYNAYDRDPFRYANAYATYAANIDATAKFIKGFYLTPRGRWWGGAPTLRSMQQFWSSSGRWGVGVSRVASSIHLDSFAGRTINFAAPAVRGGLHGGDKTSVHLTWAGGPIPAGVDFVAQWVPVGLDADAVAPAMSGREAAETGAVDAAPNPPPAKPTITTAAPRSRTESRSVTLTVTVPREPGRYLLQVDMRDIGRRPLPAAERVRIPSVAVRVWGDQAVSVDLGPSPDGTGAVVRITNTGRVTIPAASSQDAVAALHSEAGASRSVVTLTASPSDAADAPAVLLLSLPLAADLGPGASVSFDVPGVIAATGRTANWLSVSLSVLGDPSALAPYAPVGAWFPGAGLSESVLADATPTPTVGPVDSPVPAATPTVSPAPAATPTPKAPAATPKAPGPAATPTVSSAPAATPSPKAPAAPALKHVTRSYSEHSSAITYRGSWADATGAYMGGSVAWSKTAGSTVTLTFTGTSVRWVGPRGPTRGLALVLVDGRAVARVSLWRSSFVPQAVLFKRSFSTSGRHTLTIKVLSIPGHPYVAIDGFAVGS